MGYPFPSQDWLEALCSVLNSDERYAKVAQKWEGDMIVVIEADSDDPAPDLPVGLYLDLWHGSCRGIGMYQPDTDEFPAAAFSLKAPLSNIMKIFTGELDPVQAMLTRRLNVQGNMAYMLRNIPVVLDFVRCCRLVEIEGKSPA
ncbi:MAG: SCP2 sterol-binding domain-containing protein [Anaerolineales bacterium]